MTELPTPAGPNRTLPPLNPFLAASTWWALFAIACYVAVLADFDLIGWACARGWGCTMEEVFGTLTRAVKLLEEFGVVLGIGAALAERRAPWRRLSFARR